jgi:hypothetical protein
MTLRLLGMSDEERLEFEQATGIKTERIVAEIKSEILPETEQMIQEEIREIQEIVGPHGALKRLQTGGITIGAGTGVRVYKDGTLKTTIEPDGDLLVGSDITDPAGTSLAVFVNDQVYNNEEMGFGDLLLGDNTEGFANILYNASEGRFEFRIGTTITIFIDTEGALTIANDAIGISFLATDPTETMYLKSTTNDDLFVTNTVGGRYIILNFEETGGTSRSFSVGEDTVVDNATSIILDAGTDGEHVQIGTSTSIWGGKDGKETVFNEDSFDIDFRIESAANADAFKIDAGAEAASFFGTPGSGVVTVDGGTEKRLEIGADHYIPTRNASNKTTIFNEANQDMDFQIQGVTDDNLIYADASTDRVGILTNTPGFPLDVQGDANVEGTLIVGDFDIGAININEYVQDLVGAMFTGNTETGITATYQDADGTIDLVTTATLNPNTNDIFRCNSCAASLFTGTINGTPSGTSVVYTPVSGNENVLVPASTSQLGKMRLYNTTRGNSALISNTNTGTNTITLTATVPGDWANGDTLTTASQTVSGGGFNWIDIEITSGDFVGKSLVFLYLVMSDTGGAGQSLIAHPFETYSAGKLVATALTQSTQLAINTHPYKLTSNIITITWSASGAATASPIIRQSAYLY